MTQSRTGYLLLIGALGMMCGLMAEDIRKLMEWSDAVKPTFIASIFAHFSTVVIAFLGGKIIPENRNGKYTRSNDIEPIVIEGINGIR